MLYLELNSTKHGYEPVPGMKCKSESSKPPVSPHIGSNSDRDTIPLCIQPESATSSPQTIPTKGWRVAFGVCMDSSWISASHSEVSHLASAQPPKLSNSLSGKMACLYLPHSSFLPSFFIYLYQQTSGTPNCCYFHLEQANRYMRGKSFFPLSLNIQ